MPIPRRDQVYLRGQQSGLGRGTPISGASSGYEVVKRCQFRIAGSAHLPKYCDRAMKYSEKRKTWYCPVHGDQD